VQTNPAVEQSKIIRWTADHEALIKVKVICNHCMSLPQLILWKRW